MVADLSYDADHHRKTIKVIEIFPILLARLISLHKDLCLTRKLEPT